MSELATLARPYAQATFEFAVKHNTIDHWQAMLLFFAEISRNKYISRSLSGLIAPDNLAKRFIVVCGKEIDIYGKNLVRVMAENKRLQVLPQVLQGFILLRSKYEAIVEVEVISVRALKEEQLIKIKAAMEQRLSCQVKLNCQIDKSILAGLVIRFGQMVIDSSVRGRLCHLSDVLRS